MNNWTCKWFCVTHRKIWPIPLDTVVSVSAMQDGSELRFPLPQIALQRGVIISLFGTRVPVSFEVKEDLNGPHCLLSLLLLCYWSKPICIGDFSQISPTANKTKHYIHLSPGSCFYLCYWKLSGWCLGSSPKVEKSGGCYTVDLFPVGRTHACYTELQAGLPHNTTHVWKEMEGCLVPCASWCQGHQPSLFMRRK